MINSLNAIIVHYFKLDFMNLKYKRINLEVGNIFLNKKCLVSRDINIFPDILKVMIETL
jgi:hypothetical protein